MCITRDGDDRPRQGDCRCLIADETAPRAGHLTGE